MFHSPIISFLEHWSYSTGHRNSSVDPRSSRQWLRNTGRRDRSRLPVIPHKHWTADSYINHGHLHLCLSARCRKLLSDGLARFPAKFSCPHATTTSNRKRQSDRKRYNEKSPYQAPDRGYSSGTARFDSPLSWWGKFNTIGVSFLSDVCPLILAKFLHTKQLHVTSSKHGKTHKSKPRMVLVFHLIGWLGGATFLTNRKA